MTSTATEPLPDQGTRAAGAGRARLSLWLLAAAAVLGPALLAFLHNRALFGGLVNVDAMDFANVGRNLSEGRGFTTLVLRPLGLTHGNDPFAQPDMNHGPLFPLLLAAAFRLFGATDAAAAAVSGLFYVLCVPAAYLLGRRVLGHRVGLLAALVTAVSALMLEYANAALPITLAIFLSTLAFLALYNVMAGGPRQALWGVVTGALAALLYLCEPALIWLVPVLGAAATQAGAPRRGRALALFVIPFVLLAGPWMVRNAIVAGEPVLGLRSREVWMHTPNTFPGLSAYRIMPEDLGSRPGLVPDIARKVFLNLDTVLSAWPQIAANWVLAFFLPSLLFRFSDGSATALRRTVLWSFAALLAGSALFAVQMPLFVTLVPAILVYAVGYLLVLVRQAQLTRVGASVLVGVLAVALTYPVAMAFAYQPRATPPQGTRSARALGPRVGDKDVFLTMQPAAVAWYGKRPAILIPAEDADITDIRKRFPNTRWLLLTPDAAALSNQWLAVYGALEAWSGQWMAANSTGRPAPQQLVVTGGGSPLLVALEGFASFPPVEPLGRPRTNTVIAVVRGGAPGR